jgi:hypothetical protein
MDSRAIAQEVGERLRVAEPEPELPARFKNNSIGSPPTPLLPPHMLPVPAKSSETRAILLLVLGHTEHLWIRSKNVFVKARTTSKKTWVSNVAKQISCRLQRPDWLNWSVRARAYFSQGKGRAQIVVETKPELPFEIARGSRGGAEVMASSRSVPPSSMATCVATSNNGTLDGCGCCHTSQCRLAPGLARFPFPLP